MRKIYIAPSILSADFKNLSKDISLIESAGAEYLHFDVMDGHFVDNISFGLPVLESIQGSHHLVNDVHIMIENPKKFAKRFCDAGADILTFHYEACENDKEVEEVINIIKSANKKAGISIKPNTPVDVVYPFLSEIDLILVMSVEPGFGGQSFIESALDKIQSLRKIIDKNNYNCLIEVDGGINDKTAKSVLESGADILVCGSYVFKGDIKKNIESLR